MNFNLMLAMPIADCEHFTWHEALWLPKWEVHALPNRTIEQNIIETARRMTLIRQFFGRPIRVTSWYRPSLYNKAIGGAERSQHLLGRACDFLVYDMDTDEARDKLYPFLADFNIRMENLPGASWIHIDLACTDNMPIATRYFKP